METSLKGRHKKKKVIRIGELIELIIQKYRDELGIAEVKDYSEEIIIYFEELKKYDEIPKTLEIIKDGEVRFFMKTGSGIVENVEVVRQGLYRWAWYKLLKY